MTDFVDIAQFESDVYRSRFDDGSVEIFVGASLMWIGIAWVFLPDLAGLAGVLPAVFVAPFVSWRTKFLESRVGYVRFGPQRRKWERRNLVIALATGVVLFLLGVVGYLIIVSGSSDSISLTFLMPGLIAFLLAAVTAGVAMITRVLRVFVVSAVLVAGGVYAAITDANPGIPLIPAGAVAATWGIVILTTFVRKHRALETR